MNAQLSQKQLGFRIAQLRKSKQLSQKDLAKKLGISRSSLAQIELGQRNLNVFELQRLSIILSFSMDNFLSHDYSIQEDIEFDSSDKEISQERVAIPTLKINKLKSVLLYLLEKCAGKPNINEKSIGCLLYFCDFDYYELHEEHLIGATYFKLSYGPNPDKLQQLLAVMMQKKIIQKIIANRNDTTQIRYIPLMKANLRELSASEITVIVSVIQRFSNWSSSAISDYAHKDMPWIASKNGEAIDYELAFYRTPPYSVRNYEEEMDVL